MKCKIASLLSAAVLVLALGPSAKADEFSWTLAQGLIATEEISSTATTFSITFTITNTTGTNAGIYDFSLGIAPGGTIDVTSDSGTGTTGTGFRLFDNEKQDNGGTTCTQGVGGWACVDYSGSFDTIAANGGTLIYIFSGTYTGSLDTDPHLMAQGCVDTSQAWEINGGPNEGSGNCPFNGGGSFNISADGTPVPEPGSLVLFGSGLLGIAGFLRRKFHA